MDEQQSVGAQMRAITISREYGSGGGEVARRLATRLNWQLVDHEMVVRIAQSLGVSENEVEQQDEYSESFVTRILSSMRMIDPTMAVNVPPDTFATTEEAYKQALTNLVHAVAQAGHAVIVGRGSQVLLAQQRDVLHVRIVAPIEQRVTYVTQREGLDRERARARIQQKDRQRERYLQNHYRQSSEDPHLYDLVLNTGVLDLDSITEIITLALARKATRLALSEKELGPGAGSTRYTSQPEDFRPATN
ncbi:MAG: cytidylate kinase-like family protein [Ktedonobacteraceae bacterium]